MFKVSLQLKKLRKYISKIKSPQARVRNFGAFSHSLSLRTFTTSGSFPEKCDAVVIGGGSLGCSTLYHLTKLGVKNVSLVESHKLTAGTTWHSAGLVWSLRPSDIDIQLLKITREMIARLKNETGVDPGWIGNGGLFLASTKERLNEYKRLNTIGKSFNIKSEVLSPNDVQELCPLLRTKELLGALYCGEDGSIDPSGLCSALARFAINHGAKVFEGCTVLDLKLTDCSYSNNKVVQGVITNKGYIETPLIFNCTGAWSSKLCESIGINVPIVAMKHAYVVFESIPQIRGMPNIRDHDLGVYFLIKGDVVSVGGYEINPYILDELPEDFAFGLYELDWDRFGNHIIGASLRLPKLEKTGIRSTVCGPESFTPDHKPIMGEDPKVKGFFHGAGFNSAGMMLGGGCGDQLAKWAINGQPELDMFNYDIRRFSPKQCKNKNWARERSHEAYATNYKIIYKNDELLAGRNITLGPLHSLLEQEGCVYQERQSWERPGYFASQRHQVQPYDWLGQYGHQAHEDAYKIMLKSECTFGFPESHEIIREECWACRNHSVVFDMSYFGKFFLVGEDAILAAQFIFTNQMDKPLDSVIYTCMLNETGGILADLTATVIHSSENTLPSDPKFKGTGYYLAVGGSAAYFTFANIQSLLRKHKFNAKIIDESETYGLLSIQGPNSQKILSEVLGSESSFGNEDFPFSTHKVLKFGHENVRALRLSFVGELGWELHIPQKLCEPIYKAIRTVGKKYGIRNAGYRAIDSLSIEKGYRHWHGDIRADDSPIEAGLSFTCKLKDTDVDFQGRKALEEQNKSPHLKKRLFCFTTEEKKKPLWGLEAIWDDDSNQPIGYLRRADYGFTIDQPMGYGYIFQERTTANIKNFKELETKNISIEALGERIPANIHLKSPFDPQNKRIQGIYSI